MSNLAKFSWAFQDLSSVPSADPRYQTRLQVRAKRLLALQSQGKQLNRQQQRIVKRYRDWQAAQRRKTETEAA
jgi:endonuclease III